jgi:hypothetical protein
MPRQRKAGDVAALGLAAGPAAGYLGIASRNPGRASNWLSSTRNTADIPVRLQQTDPPPLQELARIFWLSEKDRQQIA